MYIKAQREAARGATSPTRETI